MKYLKRLSFALTLLAFTASSQAMPLQAPNIPVNGFFAVDKAQRGRNIRVAIVIDIPDGFHVNANRPLYRFAIPTVLKITARDLTISPVVYPRAAVRRLRAVNDEQLAVYEGRAVLRFSVRVPTNFEGAMADLKAQLKFQSCNDDTCFPPQTRDITMQIAVVGVNERVQRVNSEIFGGGAKSNKQTQCAVLVSWVVLRKVLDGNHILRHSELRNSTQSGRVAGAPCTPHSKELNDSSHPKCRKVTKTSPARTI